MQLAGCSHFLNHTITSPAISHKWRQAGWQGSVEERISSFFPSQTLEELFCFPALLPLQRGINGNKVTRRVGIVRFDSLIWPKEKRRNDSPFVIVQHRSCQFTSSSESSQIDLRKTLASFLIRITVGQYFRDTLGAIHCISAVFSCTVDLNWRQIIDVPPYIYQRIML